MRILDHLIQTIRSAAVYNADVQAAPACILYLATTTGARRDLLQRDPTFSAE